MLEEEVSTTDHTRGPPRIYLLHPAPGRRPSGRNFRHRGSDPSPRNRRYRRRARSRPRRLGFSDAPFKQADLDFVRAADHHVFHIRALRKLRLRSYQRRLPLPAIVKVLYENYEVRIPHRNFRSHRPHTGRLYRQLAADLRLAHLRFEFNRGALPPMWPPHDPAGLQAGAGAHDNFRLVVWVARTNFRRHTARAIARNFRLRTIGIDQARAYVSPRVRKQPFHAVRSHSAMAIAQAAGEPAEVTGNSLTFHEQKIVAASRRLRECDAPARLPPRRHSVSLTPPP